VRFVRDVARPHGLPAGRLQLSTRAGVHDVGYDEQKAFLSESLMVAGLDEVMDWPSVSNPENPAYNRLWGMIRATFEQRGVVEGHGAGLRDLASINAFAAAGLASDHEGWFLEEIWEKLTHGLFIELRPHSLPEVIKGLIEKGLSDWSQIAFVTDDRSASDTLKMGATDYNVRLAVENGLADVRTGGDELCSRHICNDPLEARGKHLRALHANEPAVPVGQPLRRYGRDRGEDRAHQGGRQQGFDQGEAGNGRALLHWADFRRSRTVLTCSTFPLGDCTRTAMVCGVHTVGSRGSTKSA